MRAFWLLFGILLVASPALAGVLQGRVTDEKGEALPFANVYIRNTTNGTTANEQGNYQLTLAAGAYEVVFQYTGYKARIEKITIGEGVIEKNVQLQPDVYMLGEVTIRPGGKDPAYAMIKAAQDKRKYHLRETEAYRCRVYIKNLQRLTEVPNKVMGLIKVTDLKPGIVYLSESVSELSFKQPDKYREKLISSKVSGTKKTISWNQATDFEVNFYDNLIKPEGLSQRGFISPLANNAFLFYRYQLIGSSQENGRYIHKIKVTPIRKNDPAFKGYVYLVDGEWRLQSVDLTLSKNTQLEFLDSVQVNQVFAPISGGLVWMPISQKVKLAFSGLGFKGNGYVNVIYSKYEVQPAAYVKAAQQAAAQQTQPAEPVNPEMPQPVVKAKTKAKRKNKNEPAEGELFGKKHFNNEILLIEQDAGEKDSSYWETERPVPLTLEEINDYQTKDSLIVITESKAYKDSIDAERNKFSVANLFLDGYTYYSSYSRVRFDTSPLLGILQNNSLLQYNTVEGVVLNPVISYRKSQEDRRYFQASPEFRYGLSSKEFYSKATLSWYYKPLKNATFTLEGGRFVSQFNPNNPIATFWNSLYTLLNEQNFMKLYEKRYVKLEERTEVVNGLNILATAEFADRHELFNATEKTLNDRDNRIFTPNLPYNAELPDASFGRNQALVLNLNVQYRPGQQYMSRPNRKINLPSKYPTLGLGYTKGIPNVLGSDVNFDRVAVLINDEVELGLFGSSEYTVTAGTFINTRKMWLMDYRHFNGNRIVYAGGFGGFQLLDYYLYSTNNRYLEAHFEHHFNGFILNKLPFIRQGKLQEVINVNYLNTVASGNYVEVGIGLEHIFKFLRVDFYTAFQERQKVRSGLRVGFGF